MKLPRFLTKKSILPCGGEVTLLLKNTTNNQLLQNKTIFIAYLGLYFVLASVMFEFVFSHVTLHSTNSYSLFSHFPVLLPS